MLLSQQITLLRILLRVLSCMIIFCPFHSFHPCSLHCFRKASKSCPSSPQRRKEAISNPYSGSRASALKTHSCLCGSRRDARVSRGTRGFRCPGAHREEQQQLRGRAEVWHPSAAQRSQKHSFSAQKYRSSMWDGTPKCAGSVPARNGDANRQKGLFCTSATWVSNCCS